MSASVAPRLETKDQNPPSLHTWNSTPTSIGYTTPQVVLNRQYREIDISIAMLVRENHEMYPRHIRKAVERKVDVGECRHVLSTQLGVDLLIKEPLKRQSSRSDAVEDGRIILLPVQIPIEVLIVKIEPLCLECKFDVEAVCAAMLQISTRISALLSGRLPTQAARR